MLDQGREREVLEKVGLRWMSSIVRPFKLVSRYDEALGETKRGEGA